MAKTKQKRRSAVPSREELLRFIRESPQPVGKREIARAFGIKGGDRVELKEMLRELRDSGEIEAGRRRRVKAPGALPEVAVVEVAGRDPDGEMLARPARWHPEDGEPPRIYLAPERAGTPTLETGTRVLARLKRLEDGTYAGEPIRVLGGMPRKVLGVYERSGQGGRLRPTDKRVKQEFVVKPEDAGGAEPGELVLAEVKPHHPRLGLRDVRVLERLGHMGSPKAISLISIHEHDIPVDFPPEAVAEAESAGPVGLGKREDLRELPLVTIDGTDARDFDDAVWAAPDDDPANRGGWRIVVAIADVAHYVAGGSDLDRTAEQRGNSVYFPDRVVPMLPEALSNGWCSLRPGEDRGCLAVEMRIDAAGAFRDHRFTRGLMRSAARLTYEQVQAARDGRWDDTTGPLLDPVITPLYGAFEALQEARRRRGTLDLDIAEKKVSVDASGEVVGIETRERLDAHRLIEEFMIAANVAAAETLEAKRRPCMYRVHEPPDPDKVDALRQVLRTFDITLAPDQAQHPSAFERVLRQVGGRPEAAMINQLVLRCQSQAVYSPENLGHFGLALARYAHFTSPIRRYADLLVHRSLIDALGLGDDGLPAAQVQRFADIGEHISMTERRGEAAERDAADRFTAAYLHERVGAEFMGRVNGVTHFGLFVTLQETGADGLVPIGTLPDDYYQHQEAQHCLVGRRWGRVYRLGDRVRTRLVEADPMTGGLVLELLSVEESIGGEGPEPVAPGGPGKGRRRRAAARSRTARSATKKKQQAKKTAKKQAKTGSGKPKGKAAGKAAKGPRKAPGKGR